jgi:hypothetical protein
MKRAALSAVLFVFALGGEASAQLTLTPQGKADGFTLTEFVSGFPVASGGLPASYGPFGVAVNSDRNVIVLSGADDVNYVFKDVDGQTLANALITAPAPGIPPAYAYSNGFVWGSTSAFPNGSAPAFSLVKLNNNGSVNQTYDEIPTSVGLWTNPTNGHLIAEVPGFGIVDIDVSGSTPTFSTILSSPIVANGLTVSPDGTVAYVAGNESAGAGSVFFVAGFRISDGAPVYGPFDVPDGALGVGVISDGPLKGDIEVTSDNGELYLLDALGNLTTIATGGFGGAYSSPDWTNGSLFISEADSVWRLSVTVVPEPSTWIMAVFGFVGLGYAGRQRAARLHAA